MEYPVKEVVLQKIVSTHIFVRADTDEQALDKVYKLAIEGKLEDKFTDEPYYATNTWTSYTEGVINEDVIIKD